MLILFHAPIKARTVIWSHVLQMQQEVLKYQRDPRRDDVTLGQCRDGWSLCGDCKVEWSHIYWFILMWTFTL